MTGMVEETRKTRVSESQIRRRAFAALEEARLSEVCEVAGMEGNFKSAGAALKAILADRLAEYTIRAAKVAKRKNMGLGAAAVIIAAQED